MQGSVTIIDKNDWSKVSIMDCHQTLGNYFETVQSVSRAYGQITQLDKRTIVRKNASLAGLKASMDKSQTGYLLKKAKDASPWFFASNRYKNILTKVKEYHDTPINGDNMLKDNEAKFAKLDEMKGAIDVYKREKISDGYIDENWNIKRNLSGKDLERLLFVKDLETYANRIEKEKQLAIEQKKVYDERKKRVSDINSFVNRSEKSKEFYVNKQLQEEIALQEKEAVNNDDSIHVSDNISSDININNNNIIDINLIQDEEADINKEYQVDKEKEDIIIDLDKEKEM
jgi:hypothetical protein